MSALWHRSGGPADGPVLVMLHGLGANSHVYDGMIAAASTGWAGGWLAPDLAGHGRSEWAAPYSFSHHAAQVADLLDAHRPLILVGHSMGGVVALEMAGDAFGLNVAGVVGLGIKVVWTDEELARAAALAGRPVQTFATRDEAVDRFLKVSGLAGLVGREDAVVSAGLRQAMDGWQLTMDPRGFGVGSPLMLTRSQSVTCPVRLARGEADPMVSLAQLRAHDPHSTDLPGLGHNAHVEDPDAVLDLAVEAAHV